MKLIKKIEVTPVDYNFGKIIDSNNTTDDKTKNTYSMNIIDNKVTEIKKTIEQNYAPIVKCVVTTSTGGSIQDLRIEYPNGFNKENIFLLSIKFKLLDADYYVSQNIQPKINGSNTTIYRDCGTITFQDEAIFYNGAVPLDGSVEITFLFARAEDNLGDINDKII